MSVKALYQRAMGDLKTIKWKSEPHRLASFLSNYKKRAARPETSANAGSSKTNVSTLPTPYRQTIGRAKPVQKVCTVRGCEAWKVMIVEKRTDAQRCAITDSEADRQRERRWQPMKSKIGHETRTAASPHGFTIDQLVPNAVNETRLIDSLAVHGCVGRLRKAAIWDAPA